MKPLLEGYNFYPCNNLPKSPFSSARQSGLSLESVGGNCEKRLKRKRLIIIKVIRKNMHSVKALFTSHFIS